MHTTIDLNSDLGESYGPWKMGDDKAMLKIITSANIACGFHAGVPVGILHTIREAVENNIAIGAYVSYRDPAGYEFHSGRLLPEEIVSDVVYQIGAAQALATLARTSITYIKPQGALYSALVRDELLANSIIEAIVMVDASLSLMAPTGSYLIRQAQAAGLNVIAEVYADRAYLSNGSMVPEKMAVLRRPAEIAQRMVELVETGCLTAVDGTVIRLKAQSICLRADTPDSVKTAFEVRRRLEDEGVFVCSFTRPEFSAGLRQDLAD